MTPTAESSSRSISAIASCATARVETTKPTSISANIVTVNPHDVALGRGAPFVHYEGNVRFREIVADRQQEYNTATKRKHKVKIARDIFELIASRDGRFLRRVETKEDGQQLSELPEESDHGWVVADEAVAMEKIKQALRHRERSKSPSSNAEKVSASSVTMSASTTPPGHTFVEPAVAAPTHTPHVFAPTIQNAVDNIPVFSGIHLLPQAPVIPNQLAVAFWRQQQQTNNEQLVLVSQQQIDLGRREIFLRQQQVNIQQQLDVSAVQSMMPSLSSAYGMASGIQGVIANSLNLNGLNTAFATSGAAASFAGNEMQRTALGAFQGRQQEHMLQQLGTSFATSQHTTSQSPNVAVAGNPSIPQRSQRPDSTAAIEPTTTCVARNRSPRPSAQRPSSKSGSGGRRKRLKRKREADDYSSKKVNKARTLSDA